MSNSVYGTHDFVINWKTLFFLILFKTFNQQTVKDKENIVEKTSNPDVVKSRVDTTDGGIRTKAVSRDQGSRDQASTFSLVTQVTWQENQRWRKAKEGKVFLNVFFAVSSVCHSILCIVNIA